MTSGLPSSGGSLAFGEMLGVSNQEFKFSDLREEPSSEGFDAFFKLWESSSPRREREDPEEWRQRLVRDESPRLHILLARCKQTDKVVGGLAFEYYRKTKSGLLRYPVTAGESSAKVIFPLLIKGAKTILAADAEGKECSLAAVFAEAENPAEVAPKEGAISPRDSLIVFDNLGAKWLRFPYARPVSKGSSNACRHLLLLAFPLGCNCGSISGKAVQRFLRKLYQSLGVAKPSAHADMIAMREYLWGDLQFEDLEPPAEKSTPVEPQKALKARSSDEYKTGWRMIPAIEIESPVLELKDCSVCLHFVEVENAKRTRQISTAAPHYCQDLGSMELDLLSLAFRTPPVCRSECYTYSAVPVAIHFPDVFVYNTEGRMIELRRQSEPETGKPPVKLPPVESSLSISRTLFPKSGRVVWHMSLRPPTDKSFSEYDIIKLIHLYDGHSEHTRLRKSIRFSIADGELLSARKLLSKMTGAPKTRIRGGTIEIVTGSQALKEPEGETHAYLLNVAREARKDDEEGQRKHKILKQYFANASKPPEPADKYNEGDLLRAYCGLVTGIFDFREIGHEEAMDTLEATFADDATFLRIHRCTLLCISDEDRAYEACTERIGASPYLILPHAALLHNESLVREADAALDKAFRATREVRPPFIKRLFKRDLWRGKSFGPLAQLESALHEAERKLRQCVPNIFNYVTESELFTKGTVGRGLINQREATEAKLTELKSLIDLLWNVRRETGQMVIAMMLALVSLVEIQSEAVDLLGWWYWVISAVALLAIFSIWSSSIRQLRGDADVIADQVSSSPPRSRSRRRKDRRG